MVDGEGVGSAGWDGGVGVVGLTSRVRGAVGEDAGGRDMSRVRRASAAAARRHSTMVGESNMALLRISAAFC